MVLKPIIEIVGWSFENQSPVADGGILANSNRVITRESTVSPTYPQGTGGSGTFALNTNSWHDGAGTKYYMINFETIGFRNLKLSSKQMGSNTGPRDFKLQYSLDGSNWTDLGLDITVANNWNSGVVNEFALPAIVENKEIVYVRWLMTSNTSINGGTVASGGTSRIDDIVITANPMPMTDELAVQLDAANLEIIYQGTDHRESVTEDLLLASSGINGSSITWVSSHPEIISSSGEVTRPASGDVEVTLTATIAKGTAYTTKAFTLLVLGQNNTPPVEVEPLIGYWHFNDGVTDRDKLLSGNDLQANVGSALLRTNFSVGITGNNGTIINAISGYAAGTDLTLQGGNGLINNGKYLEFEFSTLNLQDVTFSFALRGTSTGFNHHQWKYSIDGINFIEFGENTADNTAIYLLRTLQLPEDVINLEKVFVRVYLDGATGSTGNNRIDNLQINGTVIN